METKEKIEPSTTSSINNDFDECPKVITINSSLDPKYFENKDIIEFKCPICNDIPNFNNMIELGCCGKLCCKECIMDKIQNNSPCLICQKSAKINYSSKVLRTIFGKFVIMCPFDCGWKNTWQNLENHIKECQKAIVECKYSKYGCKFTGLAEKCKLHEENDDKKHLDLIFEYKIKELDDSKNPKIKIQFDNGECYKVKVHPHKLRYISASPWTCSGKDLPGGCLSPNPDFKYNYRFRCEECEFDLCPNCMIKYAIK